MVSALLIFCLMIDYGAIYLHFASGPVTLEILHVSGSIPKAPFCKGEELDGLFLGSGILERNLLHFNPCLQWHEEQY